MKHVVAPQEPHLPPDSSDSGHIKSLDLLSTYSSPWKFISAFRPSPMASDPDLDASASWPRQLSNKNYPYSPSLASTASSSSSSVFSLDAPSSQSSVSSSAGWSSSAWNSENENENQYFTNRHISQKKSTNSSDEEIIIASYLPCSQTRAQLPAEAAALKSRQHPRRTQRLNSYESQNGKSVPSCPRPPPPLVRQSDRKENFVDSLVGKLTFAGQFSKVHMLTRIILQRHHNSDD